MPAKARVLDRRYELSVTRLFISEKCARRINRRRRQAERLEFVEKRLRFVIQRARLHQPIDGLPQWKTILNVFILRVEQFGRAAEPFDEAIPMIRLVDEDTRVTILALIGFRHSRRLAMARPLRHFAGDAVTRDDSQKRVGNQHVLKRNIEMVTLT